MKEKQEKSPRINNVAIIQYQLKSGDMKILALSAYDVKRLKQRVGIHIGQKKVLSVQFYYDLRTNSDLHLLKEGVILE